MVRSQLARLWLQSQDQFNGQTDRTIHSAGMLLDSPSPRDRHVGAERKGGGPIAVDMKHGGTTVRGSSVHIVRIIGGSFMERLEGKRYALLLKDYAGQPGPSFARGGGQKPRQEAVALRGLLLLFPPPLVPGCPAGSYC